MDALGLLLVQEMQATPEIIYDYDDELKGGAHEACRYDL